MKPVGVAAIFAGLALLGTGVSGCKDRSPDLSVDGGPTGPGPTGPRVARDTRFSISLLLADSETSPPFNLSRCNIPVRPPHLNVSENPVESGLIVSISSDSSSSKEARTADDGRASLTDLTAGVVVLDVRSGDAQYLGRFALEVATRRTNLIGAIVTDRDDLDGDGDRDEGLMVIDVLPDSNTDGASDTGSWSRWIFGENDGLAYRHRPDGTTERIVLGEFFAESDITVLDDRDGDLIPDDQDDDVDGDGITNGDEGNSLPCPGFSHDPLFVVGSKHEDFSCERCHVSGDEDNPLRCDDCHTSIGRSWEDTPDNAPQGHFLRGCEMCHAADRPWDEIPGPDGELHEAFPLLGQHLQADCYRCHETGNPQPEKLCENCHLEEAGPDHFQKDCQVCHGEEGWTPSTFNHDGFPLIGSHEALDCEQCHIPPDYESADTACASCHLGDVPIKHAQPQFDQQACDDCHATTEWADYTYSHTQWLLEGAHIQQDCSNCHAAADTYEGEEGTCISCHEVPAFPAHDNFGPDCDSCHAAERWVPATANAFDHSIFPLVGSHETAACGSCHEDGNVPRPAQDCTSCHLDERPQRHVGFFEGDCAGCHQPTTWPEIDPPHEHTTAFPLEGLHARTACASCHTTTYEVPSTCITCHAADEPQNHYGQGCETCHDANNWNPTGEMNHHTADPNAFPLDNAHGNLLCNDCHVNDFGPLPRTCQNCHASDMPLGHAADGCDQCHSTVSFTNPNQPQPNAFHPLTGAHVNGTCVECHGNYVAGTGFATPSPSTACVGCHPLPQNHPIQVGTQACDSCHSVDAWIPAAGGHDSPLPTAPFPYATWSQNWFPDGSTTGTHHGANQCNKCHVQQGDYSFFSCTTLCHLNRNGLNDKHKNGQDEGNEAKKQFHLFHYSPNDANNPPDEGGGLWPSGHVGCVNRFCHPTGREP